MKDRIKTVRKKAGLTQTEFAERIGATRAMIASYEGAAVVPADTVLKLISREFSVSYDWLKTGTGPMEVPKAEGENFAKIIEAYQSLPDRLRMLVDALVEMDPEWYKTLDTALAEIERKRKNGAE